jgi:hypothetical protein
VDIPYRDQDGDQKYGPPPGRHEAKFIAVEIGDTPEFFKNGKFAKKDDDGRMYYWTFRLANGEDVTYYTGTKATKGSNCLKVMDALSGGNRSSDGVFRDKEYVGKNYTLVFTLSESGASTYISAVLPNQAQTTPAPNPAQPKKAPPKPPPPPPQQAKPKERMYWYLPVQDGQAELGTVHEIKTHLSANGLDPAQVMVCPEDGDEWVTAKSVGIDSDIPF